MPDSLEFQLIFSRLRAILREHEPALKVSENGETAYSLDTTIPYRGKPMFFGAARVSKQYVSFYLMPVYVFPDLLERASPRLKKRMQGKSCFNFRHIDEGLFAELSTLARAGFERFQKEGMA